MMSRLNPCHQRNNYYSTIYSILLTLELNKLHNYVLTIRSCVLKALPIHKVETIVKNSGTTVFKEKQ